MMSNRGSVMTAAATLAGALALVAAPAVASSPAPVSITPSQLPPGPAAKTTYLVGRVIHPAGGQPVYLPRTWTTNTGDANTLLGTSSRGWIVLRSHANASDRIYRVTHSSRTLIARRGNINWINNWRLSNDGTRLVSEAETANAPTYCTHITVMNLSGHVLRRRCPSTGQTSGQDYLGSTRYNLWYVGQGYGSTHRWNLGANSTARLRGGGGMLADPAHNKLFVTNGSATTPKTGVTSLTHPGKPAWWSPEFTPISVSPDGAYVAGLAGDMQSSNNLAADVVIRRVSNGALVQRIHPANVSSGYINEIWWEDASHILFSFSMASGPTAQRGSWLIRCSVTGSCNTAAPRTAAVNVFSHHLEADWHNSQW